MQDISVMYLLNLAWKRLVWLILAACVCAAGTFVYYGFVVDKRYTAKSSLMVSTEKFGPNAKSDDDDNSYTGSDIST